jgi:hypothetical protein
MPDSAQFTSRVSQKGLHVIIFSITGVLSLGIVLWLSFHCHRRRAQVKRCRKQMAPLISAETEANVANEDRKSLPPE